MSNNNKTPRIEGFSSRGAQAKPDAPAALTEEEHK